MSRRILNKNIPLESVLPYVVNRINLKKNPENRIEMDGQLIYIESIRLYTFKEKGCECVSCRRKGTHFRLQDNGKDPHFGFWTDDDVEMTKDHIIPRSYGGFDHVDNMQPMCSRCNKSKRNSFTEEDFIRGLGSMTYEEALKKQKIAQIEKDSESHPELSKFKDMTQKIFPETGSVLKRLKTIRNIEKRDPFADKESPDVIYALKYLKQLVKFADGKIPNKNRVVRAFPKKLIVAEKALYI